MDGKTKYLTYTPWQGELNNTRMCFETALVLAYLTKRCLVMPKEYRRHHEPMVEGGRFRPLHPAECFGLATLDGTVGIVSRDEYDRAVPADGQFDRIDLTLTPGTSVFCFPKIPALGSPDDDRLRHFAVARSRFLEISPEMEACRTLNVKSPTLEHFYTFFYFSNARDDMECKRLVRDHVKFKTTIIDTAAEVAAALGSYCALHVRRNDFLRLYPHQNIAAQRVLENTRKQVHSGTRLYIATDEPDRSFFANFRSFYDVCFIDHFGRLLPENLPAGALACVEQTVCAFAQLFIGTKLSTFSGYITRLRGYYGAADKNSYFTDGSPGSEMDNRGSPRFSWSNWVKSGNPLWGREFREAWEF